MSGRPIRLAVVGCGAIALHAHVRNARALPDVELAALVDPSPEALRRAGAIAPAATRHASLAELLATAPPDAVLVASPSGAHAADALAVLEAGCHLYLEKPIAAGIEDGERVVAAARAAGVVVAIGFNRRFHPLVLEARRRLADQGLVAEVTRARTSFCEPSAELPAWKRARTSGGGAPLDLASHHVDLLRHLLDREAEGLGGTLASRRTELDDCELRFAFGEVEAQVTCSFVRPREDRLELLGADGPVLSLDRYRGVVRVRGRTVVSPALLRLRARLRLRPFPDLSYRPALAAFLDAVRGRDRGVPTPADGLASLRAVVDAERLAR